MAGLEGHGTLLHIISHQKNRYFYLLSGLIPFVKLYSKYNNFNIAHQFNFETIYMVLI